MDLLLSILVLALLCGLIAYAIRALSPDPTIAQVGVIAVVIVFVVLLIRLLNGGRVLPL